MTDEFNAIDLLAFLLALSITPFLFIIEVYPVFVGVLHCSIEQHILQMFDWIEIWGVPKPSEHLNVVVLLKPFLNYFMFYDSIELPNGCSDSVI